LALLTFSTMSLCDTARAALTFAIGITWGLSKTRPNEPFVGGTGHESEHHDCDYFGHAHARRHRCFGLDLESTTAHLTAQLNSLKAAVNQMNNAHEVVAIEALDPGVPRNTGPYGGFSGTLSLVAPNVVCPPGSWISAIQGFKLNGGFSGIRGEAEPLSELRYSCRPLK